MAYPRQLINYEKDFNITTLYIRIRQLAGQDRSLKLPRDDILSYFSAFGGVKSVRLRNRSKQSYGFVRFAQPESAAKALQSKVHTIATHSVEINVAYGRHQKRIGRLLDLNDDCLLKILSAKCLSIWDLCSLAETSDRLKELTGVIFRRKWRICNLGRLLTSLGVADVRGAKRIFMNFGSVLSELQIYGKFNKIKREDVWDYVTRYCCDNLDSLILFSFDIPESFADKLRPIFSNLQKIKTSGCTFKGATKELFADCAALVELSVCYDNDAFITEKTFPKLKHFQFEPSTFSGEVQVNIESFLSRHQNLRVLKVWGCNARNSSIQSIYDNCKQLEQLHYELPKGATFDFSNFSRLRKLKLDFAGQSFTKSPGWNNLNFLVKLKLVHAIIDSEFVRFLPQLKELQVLELRECYGMQNLNQLDDLNQLTQTVIISREFDIMIDLPRLIQRLGNLKYLTIELRELEELDVETYLKIVKIVGSRFDKSKLYIRIYTSCDSYCDYSSHYDGAFYDNRGIVQVITGCDCYGF